MTTPSKKPTEKAKPAKRYSHASKYIPIHGDRKVSVYPVQEHELKTISICNSQVSLWASICSACVALIAACLWDMATSTEPSESSRAVAFVVACAVIAIVAGCISGYYWVQKEAQIGAIKRETVHDERATKANTS